MPSIKDLTDQRFGKLVAIRPTDERRYRSVVWECKCDCGNTALVPTISLRNGNTTSCGCAYRRIDLTGQRFGKLIAVCPTSERQRGSIVWECRCDCGNTSFASVNQLQDGHVQSCGCAYRIDITGQRFGKLIAVRPTDERRRGSVVWECKCDCGNTALVTTNNLRDGSTTSCGCARFRAGGLDITGQRFGRLVAICKTDKRRTGSIVWECKCDCGNTVFVSSYDLRAGRVQSCGCLRSEKLRERKKRNQI